MDTKMGVRLKWLGCAGFEMDFGGFTVVSDPFITASKKNDLTWEAVEHCDLMVLTHPHYDHITDIPVLHEKFKAPVICGERTAPMLAEWADIAPMDIYPAYPGTELDFGVLKVKALYGRHVKNVGSYSKLKARTENNAFLAEHPDCREISWMGNFEYRNFLFTAPSGTRLLHWGNPVHAPLDRIMIEAHPDILIQQCTGTTPDAGQLIEICRAAGTKTVIANHVDFPGDYREKALSVKEALEAALPGTRFIIPEYNVWMEL